MTNDDKPTPTKPDFVLRLSWLYADAQTQNEASIVHFLGELTDHVMKLEARVRELEKETT